MDADKLVDYIYKSTKKQAKIIPQPETEESKPKENKDEKKPDEAAKQEEEKNEERGENEEKGEEKGGENKEEPIKEGDINFSDEEAMHKLVHYYQPLYVIERIPPPQLFSDENPNACCII